MTTPYTFPKDLKGNGMPFINISSRPHNRDTGGVSFDIFLPIPQGFTISDGHGFGNLDLGVVGTIGKNSIDKIMSGKQTGPSEAEIEGLLGNENESRFLMSQAFSNFGIGGGVTDRVRNIYGQNKGIASNPNTVLQYQAPEIRTFSLQFRLIPSSSTEAEELKGMIIAMRESTYPDTNGESRLLLRYPNVWSFSFGGGAERYLPPSHDECYCTNLSVTYNSNTNIFFDDGSPADTTIQITLRESKSLVKDDIKNIHSRMGK